DAVGERRVGGRGGDADAVVVGRAVDGQALEPVRAVGAGRGREGDVVAGRGQVAVGAGPGEGDGGAGDAGLAGVLHAVAVGVVIDAVAQRGVAPVTEVDRPLGLARGQAR